MHPVTLLTSPSSPLHTTLTTSLKHGGYIVTERDGFHTLNKQLSMSPVRLKIENSPRKFNNK